MQDQLYLEDPKMQQEQLMKYQTQLAYEQEKAKIDVAKNEFKLGQKCENALKLEEIKAMYRHYLEMIYSDIFADSSGKIIYAIMDQNNSKICGKTLLNVENYRPVIYVSYHDKRYFALAIFWDGCRTDAIFFNALEKGLSPQLFLKALKSSGLILQVSGRAEKKAADALLAYSINAAEEIEIPFYHGWNLMGDGKWHFAKYDEWTMEEVFENAF